jgi:hypothetical protein
MSASSRRLVLILLAITTSACGSTGPSPSTTGRAINDLGPSTYLGMFAGGLYPNGNNTMPARHDSVGRVRASRIEPLDVNGNPSASGKYVLLSVGMSNTTQEWCGLLPTPCNPWTFSGRAAGDAAVNQSTLVIANGAKGGEVATAWDAPSDPNYDRVRDEVLAPRSLSENQVQAVWLKEANPDPTTSLPSANADAYALEASMGKIVRALASRYPNLQIVFVSSRIYAGYATRPLNPEPYAYETGFAVKWLIQAQIDQMENGGTVVDTRAGNLNYDTVAPWLAWGPYLWADGENQRSDGLTWSLPDFEADGTHPSTSGETKVANQLLTFFKTDSRASCWFLSGGSCP